MASRNTRSAVEKSDTLDAVIKVLDDKLKPINEKLEKLDKIDNSVDFALEEIQKNC